VVLPVFKFQRLAPLVTAENIGQIGARILTAGEKDENAANLVDAPRDLLRTQSGFRNSMPIIKITYKRVAHRLG